MLTSKFWLEKDGTLTDTSSTEHAFMAREKVLGLAADDPLRKKSPFYKLTQEDADRLRSASRFLLCDAIFAADRMVKGADPRWLFIEQHNAIRIAKAGFWCWRFDDEVLARIRGCKDYWRAQIYCMQSSDMMEIVALGEKEAFEFSVGKFRDEKVSLSELRKFKINPINDLTPG